MQNTTPNCQLPVILTPLQSQVDAQIDARISRIALTAYIQANRLPNGRMRKIYVPYTLPTVVSDLLNLKQELYSGADPESISATLMTGEIQNAFLNSNK